MNEDDCYWLRMTVNDWRWLLMNEDDCSKNKDHCKWMKTTVIEWRQVLINEDEG